MVHLKDKVADFFYNELSAAEMTDAKRHFEECADCRLQLRQFERMHTVLRSAPDFDPPRNVVFSEPQRRAWLRWFDWRPIAVSSAAAALVAGVIVRLSPVPAVPPAQIAAVPSVTVQAEKIDYDRIVDSVRQSDHEWLANELRSRDREIQRLRAEVAYYDTFQRAVMKETLENGSSIQLLAQRAEQR
jgi:soluble lytic murein transglycosylase-like protein